VISTVLSLQTERYENTPVFFQISEFFTPRLNRFRPGFPSPHGLAQPLCAAGAFVAGCGASSPAA